MSKNSGGQKKPFTEAQIKQLKKILKVRNNTRDQALFYTQLDTLLRSSDVLALKVSDIQDDSGNIDSEIDICQKKTKNHTIVELQPDTIRILKLWIKKSKKKRSDYLFTGRKDTKKPISHAQHTRLVKKWAELLGLNKDRYSTHSVRRTKSSIVYQYEKDITVCKELLGHSDERSTTNYLGIDKKKALAVARKHVL